MSINLTPHIEALRHGVNIASLNYDIWWVYKTKEHRPTYVGTMNHYLVFFDTSLHAHFVALLIALYSLYEKRGDTFNIPRLQKILEKENAISIKTLEEVRKLHVEAKPLWVKVGILRNKAFGHRSDSYTMAQVFKEAGVTSDELKLLVELTKNLLNTVTIGLGDTEYAFNLDGREVTVQMLTDLKAYHERKLKY